MSQTCDKKRREFISKSAAAVAGVSLTSGFILHSVAHAQVDSKAPEEAVTDKKRWGLLIDTAKCADGCNDCVSACNDEHGLVGHERPASDSQWIRKVGLRDKQTQRTVSLPLMCQHCENPPCVDVCPTGASFRRVDGIVLVDKHICIGCRYCMMACPYKARSFIHETLENQKPYSPRGKGTVESCTFCVHRVDNGEEPACVEACSKADHKAMLFGDLNNPESELSKRLSTVASKQLREDMHLNPGVRYEGV